MKKTLSLILVTFVTIPTVFAESSFPIGDDVFLLELPQNEYPVHFQNFVAEDVARVFKPLQNISNVVNTAAFQATQEQVFGLSPLEGYPEGFYSAFSVSNASDRLVFRMNAHLLNRYAHAYEGYGAISNRVAQLNALLDDINDGTITNLANNAFLSLVFLPEGVGANVTPEKACGLLLRCREHIPLSASVLDYWTESVCGTPCLMAAAKTATKDVMGLNLDPIFWIYWNGSWRFCHPAILRNLQTGK